MPRRVLDAGCAIAAVLLLGLALIASARDFDLSMPVRTGDRIDGHYAWSVERLGPDSLNDSGEIAFLDLYTNQPSSQGALSSLRRGADVGASTGGLPFTQVNAGYRAAIDGAGKIAFQALSSGRGQGVFGLPGFASWNLAPIRRSRVRGDRVAPGDRRSRRSRVRRQPVHADGLPAALDLRSSRHGAAGREVSAQH